MATSVGPPTRTGIRQDHPSQLRRGVYRFLTIDITGRRARIDTLAVDDDDAVRQGELYFESDVTLTALEVQTSSGTTLRHFAKAMAGSSQASAG